MDQPMGLQRVGHGCATFTMVSVQFSCSVVSDSWYSQLTNNVVTVSGEQKRKRPSHTYTYIHSSPNIPPIQAHITLSRAP